MDRQGIEELSLPGVRLAGLVVIATA